MEIFLEFLFTISFSFFISFITAKFLSFSSAIDQHLEFLSRSYVEVTAESEEHVFEYENGIGFDSEAVKVNAFGESVEEIDAREEYFNGSEGSREVKEGTTEGEENFVSDTTEIGLAKEDEEEIEVWDCEKEDGRDCLMEGLSDDDWEGIERNELEKDFGKAVCFLECKSNADKDFKLGNDLKMQLYGLHKIATEGPCYEPQPMALEFSARAKWNAWKRLGNMNPEAAMELYITLVSSSIPGFVQDDIHGDGKQDCADAKTSGEHPPDVKTMTDNQAIDADYRNAWKIFQNMSPEAVKKLYITLVSSDLLGFLQDDICEDGKQDCADSKTSTEQPSDIKTMADNQAIDVDYSCDNCNRTSNKLTAHIQSSDRIKFSAYTP